MPIQNIPVTNANAQQCTNDPRLLSKVEQLRAMALNRNQIIKSTLPHKEPSRSSILQCLQPRDFGIYHLINYFATKLIKDKQTELEDFLIYLPLSKQPL